MKASDVRFFVSYASEDRALVTPLVKLLRVTTPVFLDHDSVKLGEVWRDAILQALGDSTHFMVFWCRHSASSREVAGEIRSALALEMKVIPVQLDQTPLAPELARFQALQLPPSLLHPAVTLRSESAFCGPTPSIRDEFHSTLARWLGTDLAGLRSSGQ